MQNLSDAANYPSGVRKTRWHPIVCVASQDVNPTITKSLIWGGLFNTLGSVTITGASEANGLNGDLIVSKQSQVIGQSESIGLPIEGNTIHALAVRVNQQLGTNFFDETSSPTIVAQVRKLLSTDNTQDWQGSLKP
jgi:hypothetical protein